MNNLILGIGTPYYDKTEFVDHTHLEKIKLKNGENSYEENTSNGNATLVGSLGGSCTSVMKVMARCRFPTAIHGIIGDDCVGKEVMNLLKENSVTPLLEVLSGRPSGVVMCYVTPDSERTMHIYRGAVADFSEVHIKESLFKNARHVHIEGYMAHSGKVLSESIRYAKNAGSTISMDLASTYTVTNHRNELEESIPKTDYLFGNRQEMELLTGSSDMNEALEDFDTNQMIVATDGAKGCYVKNFGEADVIHYNARTISNPLDATGAGDYFCGGFLSGSLKGRTVPICVDMGNILACEVIQTKGTDLHPDRWNAALSKIGQFI